MKLITLFAALISFSSFAQDLKETTIKGADFVCADNGGAVFANLKAKKLWLADATTDKKGLEFKMSKLFISRCPNCYDFETEMRQDGELQGTVKYTVRAQMGSFTKFDVTIEAFDADGNQVGGSDTKPCKDL